MATLYFIGGASGSGKTAILPYLKELLGDKFNVYDFDEIGVPENADKKWRQESTEKWLQKILSENNDACLVGQIVLGEILSCPSCPRIGKINFCLLDVNDFERIQRLKKRNTYGADQNMLNWSAWLRMHHKDPCWMPHVIQDVSASVMDFSRLTQLGSWSEVAHIYTLDTTGLTLDEVAQKVFDWINDLKTGKITFHVPGINYTLHLNAPHSFEIVDQKLLKFNKSCVPSTQKPDLINKNFTLQVNGETIGGICSEIYLWKILYISVFFVEEKYRKQGLGTILLNKVEKEAKQFGVTLVHLDTFGFQAKDFYLKHGYEIFGVLDDCPKGYQRYYMKKVL